MNDLKWTGERFLPEVEGDVQLEHMHRYFLTSKFVKDKTVLDIACGEGYGSNLLADFAVSVTGIDISQEAIWHAQARYGKKKNLFFIQGDCSSIPLKDSSMDLVVSFETIEHHDRHQEFLLEIKRVLKKDGVLIISTPDKKEYSDLTGHINEFHVKELYFSEFEKLIKENFKHYKMLGQRIRYGSYISSLQLDKEQPFVSYKKNKNGMIEEGQSFFNPLYYISIAGDKKIPHGISSLYEQPLTESELVNHLSNELKIKTEDHNRLSEDHDKLKIELNLRITEIERANITIEQKEAFIHAILNSTSWYITKPLRWTRRKMTRLFNPNTEKPVKQTRIFFMIKKIQWFIGMIQSLGGIRQIGVKTFNLLKNGNFVNAKTRMLQIFSNFKKQESFVADSLSAVPREKMAMFDFSFLMNNEKDQFVEYKDYKGIETGIKLIAFYLPQFHPIEENDKTWGKGFTEWTNVSKAIPQFEGHYQPKLPGELGFYDLRLEDIQKRQIELAKNYGIYGFCYHYYWFDGKKILETPLQKLLSNPELDIPFCINWANENWTKRWDGLENEIIMKQNHSLEDDMAFITEIEPVLKDKRYIRINGRPLLMIYRPSLFPEIRETVHRWRDYCVKCGIGEIYLILTHAHEHTNPREIDFDAAVEFAPNTFQVAHIKEILNFYNKNYQGHVFDYISAIEYAIEREEPDYIKFRSVCPGWDNEPRKPGKGITFNNSSPDNYSKWLEYILYHTHKNKNGDEKIVFINAWNEWAEGAYLEPDRRYGYAFLDQTYKSLKKFDPARLNLLDGTQNLNKNAEIAVVLHLYYIELWDEIRSKLESFEKNAFDLYININNESSLNDIKKILEIYPKAKIYSFENRGRDILPFFEIFNRIYALDYQYVCKIHSKKSLHRHDGDQWRNDLINGLIGSSDIVNRNLIRLEADSRIGILVPKGNILEYKEWIGSNKKIVEDFAKKNKIRFFQEFLFPSGSMFWFRPLVFRQFYNNIDYKMFGIEKGQLDGTMAHSIERLFGLVCHANGYELVETE